MSTRALPGPEPVQFSIHFAACFIAARKRAVLKFLFNQFMHRSGLFGNSLEQVTGLRC